MRTSDRFESVVFGTALRSLASLSRPRALRAGAAVGSLLYRVARPQRRIALKNLALAFPEKSAAERAHILRASCRNLGRVAAEFCHLPKLTSESVGRYVHVEDVPAWEHIFTVARERGAVILSAHFGNWELLAHAHGLLGHPVTLIHRPMRNPLVDALITQIRQRAGTRLLAKKAAAKGALRALHRQELVAIPADQNQTYSFGVFADLFGKPACTTPGPARLAMLTGAPIYPVFLVREGETDQHRIVTLPEIEIVQTGDRQADIIANTQHCNLAIEGMLAEYPEQWIWFHKRWKTRPPGEPKFYGI